MIDSSDDNDPFLKPPWLSIESDQPLSAKTPGADDFDLGLRIGPIYDILRHPETKTPMAAAIYGDWGAGKTSAMKWLEGRLADWNEKGVSDRKITVHTTWFYPWKYQTQEDVWRGLVAQVIIACLDTTKADAKGFLEAAKDLGVFLGDSFIDLVSCVKFSVGLPDAAKATADLKILQTIRDNAKQYVRPEHAYLNAFESEFNRWVGKRLGKNTRMVIFIDDLDRCMPEVGLRVLEALKLYLNVEGLIFVVGVDPKVINAVVKEHYARFKLTSEKSANYLAKMFQVEATVAPSDPQIDVFLDSILSKNPAWAEFEKSERKIFRTVIRQLSAGSPREVKRLVNSALMAGAGVRMSAFARRPGAEPVKPAQGTQVFLVRKILVPYALDSFIGRELGTEFFTAWSKVVRADDKPRSIPVSDDVIMQIKQHHEDQKRPEHGSAGLSTTEEAEEALAELLEPYPPQYRELLINPSFAFADLLLLLGNESLVALMQLPYPKEAAKIGGIEADTTSAGLIGEAIARALGIGIGQVTPTDCGRVTELDLSSAKEVTSLESLKGLTNLRRLILNNTQVADLRPLKGLTNLRRLYLNYTQVADLEPLKGLTNLLWLDLDFTQVADLKPLKGLESLQGLGLNGAKEVTNLEPLEGLKSLQSLDLDGTKVANLEPLKGLESLQSLYLDRTQVVDLEPLRGLTNLRRLDLDQTQAANLEPLKLLTKLERLDLNGAKEITNLEPLEGLKSLQWLDLGRTQVADLEPLRGLADLRRLDLDQTQVANLEPLKDLTNLRRLDLDDTKVVDLNPLERLKSLQWLYLAGTQVADLEPLKGLTNLRRLDFTGTEVADLKPLKGLTNLQRLDLTSTKVVDLKNLEGMKRLQRVVLTGTNVPDRSAARLRRKIRNLTLSV